MRGVVPTFLILATVVGAAEPSPQNDMCSELAAFGNTSELGSHVARLEIYGPAVKEATGTDGETEIILATKGCYPGDTSAGKALCRFLLANSVYEFPAQNYTRVVSCLKKRLPDRLANGDYAVVRSRHVAGKQVHSEISVRFVPNPLRGPVILEISERVLQ
jgi:hypothetical protein